MTLYRGVYPTSFDVVHTDPTLLYQNAIQVLVSEGVVSSGDLVLFTSGDMAGVSGRTNTLQILEVDAGEGGSGSSGTRSPIYAFTRHERTVRRVTLYRGVYPTSFDVVHTDPTLLYQNAIQVLVSEGVVSSGDLVLFTSGDMAGVSGRTNTLQILEVDAGEGGSGSSGTEGRD